MPAGNESSSISNFLDHVHDIVNVLNGYLWGDVLIFLLLGTGIFFTLTTFFVQIRFFIPAIKEIFSSRVKGDDHHGITPFQAFVTGLASRVGVGNIAGVALAISLGGAGAVFWMWVTALIGMSSAFAESSLGQLFKIRDHENGQFRGGPAYYISKGLKQKWMAVLFAITLILTYGFAFNAIQANTIAQSTAAAWNWNPQYVGIVIALLSLPIIMGGIRRISKIAEILVPFMAVIYLIVALYIVFSNVQEIPTMFKIIFTDAFTFKSAGGGILGGLFSIAMMKGIQRGLYSNEAGMGSAPNAAAAADVKHPASQGLIQMFGVFVDTIIICSCTAFIILMSDTNLQIKDGILLTQNALSDHVGSWGSSFLAICILIFALTTILGNYAYAEGNIQYLVKKKWVLNFFRILVVIVIYLGSLAKVALVWDSADLIMGVMAIINLIAILLLCPYVWLILRDYVGQLKQDIKEPTFVKSKYPKLAEKLEKDIW